MRVWTGTRDITWDGKILTGGWRYTFESQQVLFRGDRGIEHITTIQDREITWGRG